MSSSFSTGEMILSHKYLIVSYLLCPYITPVSEWTLAIIRTNVARGVTMVIFKMAFSGKSLDYCSLYNQILFAL